MPRASLLNPFGSLPQYENRLTWAFLVALKYDPHLQNFLRELVESRLPPEHREYSNPWETARVSTQTESIDLRTNRLVSVLLTDVHIQEIKVEWSDRKAIYDGVVEYPDGLTLIVENKPSHDDVWEEQLSPSRHSFSDGIDDITLYESAICVTWSEVLEGMVRYADSDLASFGSREIARDFLSFVEKDHPKLTPYRTFELCGERSEALRRRTIRLLDDLASRVNLESREGWYLFRPSKIAERVGILIESERKLKVYLWPADTVGQACRFYEEVDKVAFLAMKGWKVEPNLHFSFVSRHLIWAKITWETHKYLEYFSDRSSYGQMDRDRLLPLSEQWKREGLIGAEDRDKIKDQFIYTKRRSLNVVPGFSVSREWDLDTVSELEKRGNLEACIIDALATPLAAWGETL